MTTLFVLSTLNGCPDLPNERSIYGSVCVCACACACVCVSVCECVLEASFLTVCRSRVCVCGVFACVVVQL